MAYADAPPRTDRWVGVGASGDPDPVAATQAALTAATAGRAAAGVLLFASSCHPFDVVARVAHDACPPPTILAGCSTAGEIADATAGSGRVVAIALGGDGLAVAASLGSLADGPRTAGEDAAAAIHRVADRPHRVLLLLTDGLTGGRTEVVRGAYAVTGADVPLVGGCAGDEPRARTTWQLLDGDVRTDATVGVAIGSDAPFGVGIGHGWRRLGRPLVASGSDGEWIHRLDDEPALDAVLRRAGAPPEAFADPSAFHRYGVAHPLGLPRPAGEEVRAMLAADYDRRAVLCPDVPEGSVVWLMAGDPESVLAGTADACDAALRGLGDHPPVGLIAFDCYARRAMLGDAMLDEEIAVVARHAPGVPLGGFYTFGEIARTTGSRGIHNATLVLLALG